MCTLQLHEWGWLGRLGAVIELGVTRATVVRSMAINDCIIVWDHLHAVLHPHGLHLSLEFSPFICCERIGKVVMFWYIVRVSPCLVCHFPFTCRHQQTDPICRTKQVYTGQSYWANPYPSFFLCYMHVQLSHIWLQWCNACKSWKCTRMFKSMHVSVQLQKCCPSNVHATQVIHISSILQESKK